MLAARNDRKHTPKQSETEKAMLLTQTKRHREEDSMKSRLREKGALSQPRRGHSDIKGDEKILQDDAFDLKLTRQYTQVPIAVLQRSECSQHMCSSQYRSGEKPHLKFE